MMMRNLQSLGFRALEPRLFFLTRPQLNIVLHRTNQCLLSKRQAHTSGFSQHTSSAIQWSIFTLIGTGLSLGSYKFGQRNASSQTGQGQIALDLGESSVALLKDQSHPAWNMSQENIDGAHKELLKLLGSDGVDDSLTARINHSSTKWSEAPNGDKDKGSLIVYPKSTKDVSELAKICHRRRIPMIPFSGGTSLESTLAAIHHEVYVDFSRMNKIIEVHDQDMDVVVQSGIGYEELNDVLAEKKLFFPPDPGPGAQIGGMVAQGCSGTNAYRYGTMKDWVLGLTVVLVDGTIIKTRHRPRKSSAGYDLTRLFVGSEGTLGFVTEASLRLAPIPERVRVAVAAFPDLQSAVQTAVSVLKKDLMLGAMELLDQMAIHSFNKSGQFEVEWPEHPTLFFKFSGSEEQVAHQVREVEIIAKEQNCKAITFAQNEEETENLWMARKTVLFSLQTLKSDPNDSFISADICVPVSRLDDLISATNASFEKSGLPGSCLGHVGDGNIHASLFFAEKDRSKAISLMQQAQKLGVEMGGTVTGEHGIGLVNREALLWELGEDSVAAMRRIKLALDPLCLMNPGKMFKLWPDQQ